MRLTLEEFAHGMELLALVHGNEHAVFKNSAIGKIWFEFFASRYGNAKFQQMIEHYLGVCHWFPKVPNDICKVWEESGCNRPPGENWQAVQEQLHLSLPSTEAQAKLKEAEELKSLSSEQMAQNRRRLKLLQRIAFEMRDFKIEDKQSKIEYLAKAPFHELEAAAKTCHKAKQLSVTVDEHGNLEASPNALFEDMQKYFHSGSERFRKVAIDWASDPANECELVKWNGQVVDIRQINF